MLQSHFQQVLQSLWNQGPYANHVSFWKCRGIYFVLQANEVLWTMMQLKKKTNPNTTKPHDKVRTQVPSFSCVSWTVFPLKLLLEQAGFTSRCLSLSLSLALFMDKLILVDLQQDGFFFFFLWVGWGELKKNVRMTLAQMADLFWMLTWRCLNDICIHLKLLAVEFEIHCNVLLFSPTVLILEVFLVIIIRLHFTLKDDEENNQIVLDLAVYRLEFIFLLIFGVLKFYYTVLQLYFSL